MEKQICNIKLGDTFILKEDINSRDGVILKGTVCLVDEYNENETNDIGEPTPFKISFLDTTNEVGTNCSDWFNIDVINSML